MIGVIVNPGIELAADASSLSMLLSLPDDPGDGQRAAVSAKLLSGTSLLATVIVISGL